MSENEQSPERKDRTGRPSQPPRPEFCRLEGKGTAPGRGDGTERPVGGVNRDNRGPQAGVAPRLSNPASKDSAADGDGVTTPEPHVNETAKGEVLGGPPGSKSVAHGEGEVRNLRDPGPSRRSNCGNQAGRTAQRQEEPTDGGPGVRSVHSNPGQGHGPDPGEGTDTMMKSAQETSAVRTTESSWRTSLRAIAKKAAEQPTHRFGGLYRMLNEANLRECFFRLRKEAAPGVDGVSFGDYAKDLDANLRDLVQRLRKKSYHARLVRRKYIPKGNGKLRPLGIPTLEDKLVQYAVARILSAIYEADFLPCSYGYREGRSARDAIRDLTDELYRGRFEFVVEADIKGFFDHLQPEWLLKMLAVRIDDEAMLQLVRKWMRAGILEEDGRVEHPEMGTPQGGIVSPVLANVYLHYVLDLWFERVVRRANRGQSRMFRYADDFVCAFDYRHEADAFVRALAERLAKFGLELAPDKTRNLRFGRDGREYNGRFDFLGFEFSWGRSRTRGHPIVQRRTSRSRLRAAIGRFSEWIKGCRSHRMSELMETVARKYRGHWSYYGIIGNSRSLWHYHWATGRSLFKWLNRRSQRRSFTWPGFVRLLERYRVPRPRIMEKALGGTRGPSRSGGQPGPIEGVNLFGASYRPSRA